MSNDRLDRLDLAPVLEGRRHDDAGALAFRTASTGERGEMT
jgi:hypothetical protein